MSRGQLQGCRYWVGLIGIVAALPTAAIQPVERTVWGQVTQVAPIIKTVTQAVPKNCPSPKPSDPASLAKLVTWDMDLRCKPGVQQLVSGYVVHYTWDGRTYKTTMPSHPGSRVRLKLTIR